MDRLFLFIIIPGILVYMCYQAYWPWFKPEEYRERTKRLRGKLSKNYPFLPEILTYRFLSQHSSVDLWQARIGYLLIILIFMMAIAAGISNIK